MARPKGPPIETRPEPKYETRATVLVSKERLASVDRIARNHRLTREGAIDWLLESAIWNWKHGSLPEPRRSASAKVS